MPHDDNWVTLVRFPSVHEAEVARGLLQTAEIPALVLDAETVGIAWHLAEALGGVRLQVRPEDREAALAVLTEEAGEEEPVDDEDHDPDEAARKLARRALGAALVGVLVPVLLHVYSAGLLVQLAGAPGRLDRRGRAWALMALALDLLVLGSAAWVLARRMRS